MQRGQFTFYRSFWEAVQYLTPADRLSVLEGIARYALDGEEPELTDVGRAMFFLIRPVLDTSAKKASGGVKMKDFAKTPQRPEEDSGKMAGRSGEDSGKIEGRPREDSAKEKETETENEIEFENERENETETDHVRPCVAREWLPGLYVIDAPSEEEVRAYCRKIGSRIDSTKFLEYYAEREWKIDGVPIRNWKAVLRSWDDRELHGRAEGRETAWAG